MNRDDWKRIYQWLETASLEALDERAQQLETLISTLYDPQVRHDAVHILNTIEQEKVARVVFKPARPSVCIDPRDIPRLLKKSDAPA